MSPFGTVGDGGEQFRLAEAELTGESLMFHEQPEFGVGMTNHVTMAREGGRKQGADALLQRRELPGAGEYAREPARVAAPWSVGAEQFLRADDPDRATVPPRAMVQ